MGELFETCRNYLLLVANISVGDDLRAGVAASDLVQETFLEAGEIFSDLPAAPPRSYCDG